MSTPQGRDTPNEGNPILRHFNCISVPPDWYGFSALFTSSDLIPIPTSYSQARTDELLAVPTPNLIRSRVWNLGVIKKLCPFMPRRLKSAV